MGSSIRITLILLAVALLCHCSDNPTKPDSPPLLASVAPQNVQEGARLEFVVQATDPDGTVSTIRAVGLPNQSSFVDGTNGTGLFTFTPDTSQAGHYNVTFVASDGEFADSETAAITVLEAGLPANHAPVLDEIGPQTVRAGDTLRFDVTANDQDGTIPSLFAENLPDHSSFTSAGDGIGLFMFAPDTGQIGTYSILFYASDGELADSETVFIISVHQTSKHRPVLLPIAPQTCVTTIALSFTVMANDSDYDIFPTIAAFNLPVNASFVPDNNGTGVFSFTPDSTQLGVFEPAFVASDGELADTESVTITITPYRPSELWPMAVGNYWVYETSNYETNISDPGWRHLWDSTRVRIDSVYVQSCSQGNGVIRWSLSDGVYVTARNDRIFYGSDIALPLVWPDRADSVPAGIFNPTYEGCTLHGLLPSIEACLVFARGAGIIKKHSCIVWSYDASCSVSHLIRYHIK